ncbi:uncharacterized protein RCC_04488 [Ramularia collo-cygni]|uniref:Uncharacterized protein n=1 Tax=Ramularia collo-cygni TaxID=112498 RepID=A0A2D3V7V1_9PEZI|nr:uncharacterized protein RCC_04488 [Ramularia collo-cygni]CZT18644.1 uncharacterized protein RCC_04488 [Ramularia collo-cygni]
MDEQGAADLGARFEALPTELRAHIFSTLLVRHVKWDVRHLMTCQRSMEKTTSGYIPPSHHDLPESENIYICAECGPVTHERNWRHAFERGYKVYESPWRSTWAPPQSNPFLCTICYDERWRSRPFPEPTNLPCLCARRKNLEVRLVCRQWNVEASEVFFSENTFAFDDSPMMGCFFSAIPQHWTALITKVSLLLPLWKEDDNESIPNTATIAASLSILDDLTWLRYLELDAKLLNKKETATALLECHISSLRQVRFVVECPYKEMYWREVEPPTYVWAELQNRHLLVGQFPEVVARSMKSQSTEMSSFSIEEEVERQRELYRLVQDDSELWGEPNKPSAMPSEDLDWTLFPDFDV